MSVCLCVVTELAVLIPAVLWTRKDIREFKDSLRKNTDNVLRVSSLSVATVSIVLTLYVCVCISVSLYVCMFVCVSLCMSVSVSLCISLLSIQDAQLLHRDCAARCVIVLAKSGRLELGDNI